MMSKHYIYEIFGRKIGATNDVERRMKEQKAKEGEYRIIEEHTNAKICSIREIELQKEYNYPVDKIQYWKTLKMAKKSQTTQAQKKRVDNTDYKARKIDWVKKVANTDYQAFQAKRVANTNWETAFKTREIDYVKKVANTDYQAFQAKRVASMDWEAYSANRDWKDYGAKRKKPVNQYDLEGNFIKRWDSAIDAYKGLGLKNNNITHCCIGKSKTSNKFIWKYAR
jgi:hypothetical protein